MEIPGLQRKVDFSFALHTDPSLPFPSSIQVFERNSDRGSWNHLPSAERLPGDRMHVVWVPSVADYGVHPGDSIQFAVILVNGDTPQAFNYKFSYEPRSYQLWNFLWTQYQREPITTSVTLGIPLIYVPGFRLVNANCSGASSLFSRDRIP